LDDQVYSFEDIEINLANSHVKLVNGGQSFTHVNAKCDAMKYRRVAIIIPYRDRLDSLKVFLNNMHLYWTSQGINYTVLLVEPLANLTFNRGSLMNIGFKEMLKSYLQPNGYATASDNSTEQPPYWDCFIFHDCDMVPQDIRVEYTCHKDYPVQMATGVQKYFYAYSYLFILV
jgi:hypothetical protein